MGSFAYNLSKHYAILIKQGWVTIIIDRWTTEVENRLQEGIQIYGDLVYDGKERK